MDYRRDLAPGWTEEDAAAERAHIVAQLSAQASPEDDPDAYAEEVQVTREELPGGGLSLLGSLDRLPHAPYLEPGYEPLAEVDSASYEAEVTAAVADEETVRRG